MSKFREVKVDTLTLPRKSREKVKTFLE